jgi:1-acyl-sn-glycerol-3-phosphate acyltransferase
MAAQAILLILPGRGPEAFALFYWAGIRRILGIRLTVHGTLTPHRPVLFIANHCSWADIVVLGSILPGCFVAKSAIASWPFISLIARLGRTIFVSRQRRTVGAERNTLATALTKGKNIILFPEGTTSDGTRVLSFSSSLLALAEGPAAPAVQPVTLVYDRLNGTPIRRRDRPAISWYGDMDLAPHAIRVLQYATIHATLVLSPAIEPGTVTSRKQLSTALQTHLAHRAGALRQGREEPYFL